MALGAEEIDAASFTIIRLFSGAVVLLLILGAGRTKKKAASKGSWVSALMLFSYAITFSYAYITLDTATGALILFGAVQTTMVLFTLISGNKLQIAEWTGLAVSFLGFIYLTLPGLTTPSLSGFILMSAAGIAWGVYTLKGRESLAPLSDNAYNFLRTLPLVIIVAFITIQYSEMSLKGILLASASGAVASGIGYAVWYKALGGLSAIQASVVQLLVPVIAAAGGVIFMSEIISMRLLLSSILILGGIMIVIFSRNYIADK
jgi:drug/metabolite transporter (DMT)-like permease